MGHSVVSTKNEQLSVKSRDRISLGTKKQNKKKKPQHTL